MENPFRSLLAFVVLMGIFWMIYLASLPLVFGLSSSFWNIPTNPPPPDVLPQPDSDSIPFWFAIIIITHFPALISPCLLISSFIDLMIPRHLITFRHRMYLFANINGVLGFTLVMFFVYVFIFAEGVSEYIILTKIRTIVYAMFFVSLKIPILVFTYFLLIDPRASWWARGWSIVTYSLTLVLICLSVSPNYNHLRLLMSLFTIINGVIMSSYAYWLSLHVPNTATPSTLPITPIHH